MIGIEASALTLALIGGVLIYIQAARLLLGDGRVGVGIPSKKSCNNTYNCEHGTRRANHEIMCHPQQTLDDSTAITTISSSDKRSWEKQILWKGQ